MNVINLLEEIGIQPKRVASSKGGEYHSPCPDKACDGNDRFCVWPNEGTDGRYWCRKCLRSGDAIQFCREFLNLDFKAACIKVGRQPIKTSSYSLPRPKEKFVPKALKVVSNQWSQKANDFIRTSHQHLLKNPKLLNQEKDRGLTIQSIIDFQLGWNPQDVFESRELWGLSDMSSERGSRLLCLPRGIVIPSFRDTIPIRVKIRRNNSKPEDQYPKYHILAGGMTCPSTYGDTKKPIVIVEAELDAMLIQELSGDICSSIALGGVTIRPDVYVDQVLKQAPLVIYALDFDEAGKNAYNFWKSNYPNIKPWPTPKGKSPGDAYNLGVNLRSWVEAGLKHRI